MEWLNAVWAAMNSPIGITVAAGILAWLLKRVYMAKPRWKAFEGTIIGAIKYAEKEIPDHTENKSLKRLDCALGYVLKIYAQKKNHVVSPEIIAELREAIGVKHAELEAAGNLHSKTDQEVNRD